MADTDTADTVGDDLPSFSAADEAAFTAMESEAATQRASIPGGQNVRLSTEDGDPESTPKPAAPVPTPVAPAAPTPAAPAPAALAPPAAAVIPVADEDDPDAVAATDGKKYVPVSVLVKTRQGLSGQVKDLQAALEASNRRQDQILAAVAAGKPIGAPAAAVPATPVAEVNPFDKNTHPIEHLEWKNDKLERDIAEDRAARAKEAETQTQRQNLTEAQNTYIGLHNQFAADPKNTGFSEAYKFATSTWQAQYEAMGYSKADAMKMTNNLEWDVVQRAVNAGVHPSAMLWNAAKAAGWKPADPTPAPAPPPAPALTPAKAIELAAAGGAAAVSLSDVSGGAAAEPMTAARLAAMSKEEFDEYTSGTKGAELFRKAVMPGRSSAAA